MTNRHLHLTGEVNQAASQRLATELHALNSESSILPITLHIDSVGGDVESGFSIIDSMMGLEAPVHTIVEGIAHGTAADILAAGSPGFRLARDGAKIAFVLPAYAADAPVKFSRGYPNGVVDPVVGFGI